MPEICYCLRCYAAYYFDEIEIFKSIKILVFVYIYSLRNKT